MVLQLRDFSFHATTPEKYTEFGLYHCVCQRTNCEPHDAQAQKNQDHIEDPAYLGELILRLRADGRDGHQRAV